MTRSEPTLRTRFWFAALLATVVLAMGLQLPAEASQRVPAQTDPGITVTTTENLLEGTTTTAADAAARSTTVPAQSVAAAQKEADADTRRVWYVVAALVVVALLILGLTILYWRRTSPHRVSDASVPRHARPETDGK